MGANALTNYAESLLLNILFRNNSGGGAYTPPANVYAALFTAAPGETGGGTEVSTSSTGYSRSAMAFGAPADVSGAQTIANSGAVTIGTTATGAWGTVTDMAIMDASTAGNMLAYSALAASKVVGVGDGFSFPAGSVTIGLN